MIFKNATDELFARPVHVSAFQQLHIRVCHVVCHSSEVGVCNIWDLQRPGGWYSRHLAKQSVIGLAHCVSIPSNI